MVAVTIRRSIGLALVGVAALGATACAANNGAQPRPSGNVTRDVTDPSLPASPTSSTTPSPNPPVATQCPDGGLTVDTNGASIAIVGGCTGIHIEANNVTLIGDAVGSIDVNGNYCTVTVGETESINVNGDDNIVTATGTGSVAVDGNRNMLTVPTRTSVTFHEDSTDNSLAGLGTDCTLVDHGEGNTAVAGSGALPTVS